MGIIEQTIRKGKKNLKEVISTLAHKNGEIVKFTYFSNLNSVITIFLKKTTKISDYS